MDKIWLLTEVSYGKVTWDSMVAFATKKAAVAALPTGAMPTYEEEGVYMVRNPGEREPTYYAIHETPFRG